MATDLKGFWTGGLTNVKDPKRNFRFKVSFLGTGASGRPLTDGGIWYAKSCTQPSVTMTESVHDFMIHKFYWPAKAEWNEVDMVLGDPVEPDSSSNPATSSLSGNSCVMSGKLVISCCPNLPVGSSLIAFCFAATSADTS